MKAGKDAVVASAELAATFQTTIEGRAVWPVRTNQLEILLGQSRTCSGIAKGELIS